MTFRNQFCLAVKDSNKNTLRELDGNVYLPFNQHYSLFLKNMNSVRAKVSVNIDGTDVLGGTNLVMAAHSVLDLERFVDVDKKFLFVPLDDGRVQDPTASQNGIISVTFCKEVVFSNWSTNSNILYRSSGNFNRSDMSFTSCSIGNPTPCCDGATVAGEVSNQKFVSTDSFLTETNPTILTLKLVGSEHIVTVKDTKNQFCGACGYKGKFGDNFCRKCGHKL